MRDGSLVLVWVAPLYEGRCPVTGYLLEISQGNQPDSWTALNEKPISETRYKVREATKQLRICSSSDLTEQRLLAL